MQSALDFPSEYLEPHKWPLPLRQKLCRLVREDETADALGYQLDAGAGITTSPAVAAGRLVIGSRDGKLYVFG